MEPNKPRFDNSWGPKSCELCKACGREKNNHLLEECYANPESENARPSLVRMRWAQLKKMGTTMPECMK